MPLDPQARQLLDLIDATGAFGLTPEMQPDTVRRLMARMTIPSDIAVADIDNRMIPGPAGEIPVRIYRPDGDAPKPAIVFFHGGGWVIGNLETHDAFCRELANAVDGVVASVDYRLAPEHRFPAAVDDCVAALGWVHDHAAEIGADPSRIAVAGDSAGGNLAAVAAQIVRDTSGPALCFQLLIYPVIDYEFDCRSMNDNAEGYMLTREGMRWFYSYYLDDPAEGADPRVSPIRATRLAGLPPAFVITAEFDPLRDHGVAYAAAMCDAGTEVEAHTYEGMFHGFLLMGAVLDTSKVAFEDCVVALRATFERA